MKYHELLDRPISFQRAYVTITGDVASALFLSQLAHWDGLTSDPEGWINKTAAEWEEETGLTTKQKERIRKRLRELGVLEENLTGIPARLHYRLNGSVLNKILQDLPSDKKRHSGALVPGSIENYRTCLNGGHEQ